MPTPRMGGGVEYNQESIERHSTRTAAWAMSNNTTQIRIVYKEQLHNWEYGAVHHMGYTNGVCKVLHGRTMAVGGTTAGYKGLRWKVVQQVFNNVTRRTTNERKVYPKSNGGERTRTFRNGGEDTIHELVIVAVGAKCRRIVRYASQEPSRPEGKRQVCKKRICNNGNLNAVGVHRTVLGAEQQKYNARTLERRAAVESETPRGAAAV